MVCKKARDLLEEREKGKLRMEQDETTVRHYLSEGICPDCGCTNITKTHINTIRQERQYTIELLREYKLKCNKCGVTSYKYGDPILREKQPRMFGCFSRKELEYDKGIKCTNGGIV